MKNIEFLKNNGVNVDKSLDLFGSVDTYNDTIGEFLVGIHKKINDIIKMFEAKDLLNYEIYVHSLKNDAKNFGFEKLAEIAYEHELKSKGNDIAYITQHINDLIQETNNAIVLIQEYMNDTDVDDQSSNGEVSSEFSEYDSPTILVVDDSNIIRNFVKRIFSDRYNVGTAKDGEEAISIIKANQNNSFIEAILLDLNMPNVDGFAVLEFMRQNDLLKKMPVSIISGDSTKETIDRAFTYEIVDMLGKPFNEQSVKMVIEKTLIYKEMNS